MRTVRLALAAYATTLLLITGIGAAIADVPIGGDGFPIYDIKVLSQIQYGDSTFDESRYETGDDSPTSTQSPYARTVMKEGTHQVPICGICTETVPSSGFAQARANLFSGTLKAQAIGSANPFPPPNNNLYLTPFVQARADLSDLIFFDVGSFDTTNGLPVKVIFRVDGSADLSSPVSGGDATFNAQLYVPGIPTRSQLGQFHYGKSWRPDVPVLTSISEDWQLVNGAYEKTFLLSGTNPVLRLVLDLTAQVNGGDIDYYHTAALSLELPPGVTFTSGSGVLLTRSDFEGEPSSDNRAPVANAGPDRTVEAGAGCTVTVTLDGSGSSDPDAASGDTITSYTWAGLFNTASGPNPVVAFAGQPIGENTFTLTVADSHGGTGTDNVVVTVVPPSFGTEICNGQDDDCDGTVDESSTNLTQPLTQSCYTGPASTRGIGVCRDGTQTCSSGTFGVCGGQVLPTAEVCGDGLDNDCNGVVDNGCVVACATNISPQVTVDRGGFRLDRKTGRYVQTIKIKNTSASAIQGPVVLALDMLSSTATLFNANGMTTCAAPLGSPLRSVNVGSDNVLSRKENASVTLEFTNPSNSGITYTTRVLAGSPQ